MRIAYILPSLINQGPGIVVHSLIKELLQKNCLIDLYYFDDFDGMSFDCPTYHISMKESIDFDKYDIIHSHCLRADIYVYRWQKTIKRAKTVTTLHQYTYKSLSFQYNIITAAIVTAYWCYVQRKFDKVVAISKQLADTYRFLLGHRIATIYNGISIDIETPNTEEEKTYIKDIQHLRNTYKVLGTYAYITKRKGLSQIIHILPNMPDYAFVVIGEGPELTHLKQLAIKKGVSNRILFLPYLQKPYNYLHLFDVYMMTSYSEGFGLAMVEAAFAQKSIVCSDIPSFHEIFPTNEVVFFQLNDRVSLLTAISKAYQNREQQGRLAYKRVKDNFTDEIMANNYLNLYFELLK
jgi:glycosyltransferase involved in cell wall biosynthesis